MKAWTRWQDWTTFGLGVVLLLSPWIFGAVSTTAFAVDAWFVGVLSVAIALLSLAQPGRFVTEWITLILGIWLFLSSWFLSFTTVNAATAVAWIIGLLLGVTSGWVLGETRKFHVGAPTYEEG